MKFKREWHLIHSVPKKTTMEQRIAWRTEHEINCTCTDIPEKLKEEINRNRYE